MNEDIRLFLDNLKLTMQIEMNALKEKQNENKKDILQNQKEVNALTIRTTVSEENIKNMQKILDKINGNTTWILRLIISVIVMAILGLLFR